MALPVQMELPTRRRVIAAALEGLVAANVEILREAARQGRHWPRLYDAGVVFRAERPGREDWQHVGRLYDAGEGDCEDVSCARAAELRWYDGEPATVDVVPIQRGNYHAIVRRADGTTEDPSVELIIMEATQMRDKKPRLKIQELRDGGCIGTVTVPCAGGHTLTGHAVGFDLTSAVKGAVSAVLEASNNPAIYPMLPWWAAAGLFAIHGINELSDGALSKMVNDKRASASQVELAKALLRARQNARAAGASDPGANQGFEGEYVSGPGPGSNYDGHYGRGYDGVSGWFGTLGADHRTVVPVATRDHRTIGPGPVGPGGRSVPSGATVTDSRGRTTQVIPVSTSQSQVTAYATAPGIVTTAPSGVPGPGQVTTSDSGQSFVWVPGLPDGSVPGHWERPSALNQPVWDPQNQGGFGLPPAAPPVAADPYGGYPPPPYAYPPPPPSPYMYGSPYGYPAPYGYDPTMAAYQAGWYGAPGAEPLTLDDMSAMRAWGVQAFAEGAYPGYQTIPYPTNVPMYY